MSLPTPPEEKQTELGFSPSQGANWTDYLAYRPLYPPSFYARIYAYHATKPLASWTHAHDIGTGCGIVASSLASRFAHVTASDPNDGYIDIARRMLLRYHRHPGVSETENKFTFLQERGERSWLGSGTVDLASVCESVHWMDTRAVIGEAGRELKVGGTLVLSHYTFPRIMGNDRAQRVWEEIRAVWVSRMCVGDLLDRAVRVVNMAYEGLEFPPEEWERVQRVYVNSGGSLEAFKMDERVGERRVGEGEEIVWVEDDEDWCDSQGINWFKGYMATWVPCVPESDMKGLWDEMESALDGKVGFQIPLVMTLATKK
ncbi:class I SAM-dependent methyltransferase [Aspergillus melleus]|uniref:class I SAM-dependent methyltransferase n=1 Tax=Aspergillus melleus TaxID=138277 RepID=UPI001E8D6F1E|nr:trans-aconitate methyltransferase 1 [Aspergillus melleus]KAH8432473.1 trans-aconitate methyltransferase 1 [Aspergillus melleus]